MAAAVCDHYGLARLDLMVSRRPLAKENVVHPRFEHQVEILRRSVLDMPGLEVETTELQLLSDIGQDYDLMVLGADKWDQIQQVQWYGGVDQRDQALARLPRLVVFPRAGSTDPPADRIMPPELVPPGIETVSSSRARAGEVHLMAPAARRFAEETGAWVDPERYDRWVAAGG